MSSVTLSSLIDCEAITKLTLDQFHSDLKEELEHGDKDDAPEVLRLILAIETVFKELMLPQEYFVWKLSSGLDIH
jgi:hypothetical protein|tara:strand:+ start:464 stop:688 length:225 start_codon:yes stop_codon:yes gene_type:complete